MQQQQQQPPMQPSMQPPIQPQPSMMMYQQQQPPMSYPQMMMTGQPQYQYQQQPQPTMQPPQQQPNLGPQQTYPNYGNQPMQQPQLYSQYPPQQQQQQYGNQPMQQYPYQYPPMMNYPQQEQQQSMKQLPPLPMKQQQQQPMQPIMTSTTTTVSTSFPVQGGNPIIMMDSPQPNGNLQTLQHCATKWFEKRKEVLTKLAELTDQLNKRSRSTTKAKVGGTVSNIVGASLIVGGLITAPLTLGGSLVATGAGAALVGGGTAATVGAAVSEWKHAKKSAKAIQEALEQDTKHANELIALAYDFRNSDPTIDQQSLTFMSPTTSASSTVTVLQLVQALVNQKQISFQQTGKLTHGHAGAASLASLVVKGVVPIVSVPIDFCLLVKESKKLHGKEPSKLATQVAPIIENLKYQTKMATGISSL
ncbi:hypothetical protein C9374_005332 [Naegleria lovaniensis]|uniref:Uncharacterized protein n=1 Tax=Naegleria lovaniensis TaxID=51637 RepID=A0AA88GQP5_NAELO|nr:uncharacterized protein C9374_005332 [Naegleria lovaniensis]KAG2382752.1 hypothetical protein C9374_005332 [Naegleria lovaniensis]